MKKEIGEQSELPLGDNHEAQPKQKVVKSKAPPGLPFVTRGLSQFNADWNDNTQGYDIRIPDGSMFYSPEFFKSDESDRIVKYLSKKENIAWKQEHIRLYGKLIALPRLTAWYGDPGASYTYSGISADPEFWTDELKEIKERIKEIRDEPFNSVLLNWYRNGKDSLNWHADDEPELGPDPVIASANFGATRSFQLRRKDNHDIKIEMPLEHGTVLVMRGAIQRYWEHCVPKRMTVKEQRFNLTFRMIGKDRRP